MGQGSCRGQHQVELTVVMPIQYSVMSVPRMAAMAALSALRGSCHDVGNIKRELLDLERREEELAAQPLHQLEQREESSDHTRGGRGSRCAAQD
jgi:hypothetical protein